VSEIARDPVTKPVRPPTNAPTAAPKPPPVTRRPAPPAASPAAACTSGSARLLQAATHCENCRIRSEIDLSSSRNARSDIRFGCPGRMIKGEAGIYGGCGVCVVVLRRSSPRRFHSWSLVALLREFTRRLACAWARLSRPRVRLPRTCAKISSGGIRDSRTNQLHLKNWRLSTRFGPDYQMAAKKSGPRQCLRGPWLRKVVTPDFIRERGRQKSECDLRW
jgi:hypothetical protein